MRVSSIAMTAALAPMLIAAKPVELQPSSPWVLDYAENSCRLIRTFGAGSSTVKLGFESDAPDEMDLLAVGKPLGTAEEEVGARFVPLGGEPFKGRPVTAVANGDPAILWSHVPVEPEDLRRALKKEHDERERHPGVRPPPLNLPVEAARKEQRHQFAVATTGVEIQTRRDRPVILQTGSLGAPMAAFDKCSRDSLKDWGVDPDLEDKIVRPVWAPNPASWFSPSDYPGPMAALGEQSEVKVRLLVNAEGKVTKCTSLSHFNLPAFDKVVCDKFTQRAVFQPAELADGTKVPSYYTVHVRFELER